MAPSQLTRRSLLLGGAALLGGSGLAACSPVTEPVLPELILATGPPGAVYREIGTALVDELSKYLPRTNVRTVQTGASVENLSLLAAGRAHLGFVSLDAMLSRQSAPVQGVSAVGRLYDSFLHLVVPESSSLRTVKDLSGRRVSVGAAGSGTEYTVERLRRVSGISFNEVRLNQAESARQLEQGMIDAFFTLTGIPTPAILDVMTRVKIRLVEMNDEAHDMAEAEPSSYVPATIPKTTYTYLAPCRTLSVPNVLVTRDDLPDNVVRTVTETVFTKADTIAKDHAEARRINRSTGIATGPVPLHPGAAAWFRQFKR
ncbi:TRAP transporter TAXI family solute receptor [Crossiella equi]|uniref:TRAP transporter TAXI family solute receptor n=1 Tax=Crossiella equi TaxID=130796 RepID=A0ABS5AL64_9PSEU|nr:TAXI family TRAP transporter solute-binding subunit [Crossiella equi]MBP2477315.1 TRAP transporter TAXI family solute receptor [Crossiella equi]